MSCHDGDVCSSASENLHSIVEISLGETIAAMLAIGKLSAMIFYCVQYVWSKNLIPASCFPLVHCNKEAATRERAFLVYCERCPNVDHISRRAKIDADTAINRFSQNNPCRKLIQISSLLLGWPSCIDIFHNLVRLCVLLFNATGRIFHPEMLYCFRNSILGLNISGPLDVGYTGRRNRNGLLSWL